ncbi:MAG: response regulator [Chthoniobacterales bacterium]|nr:response regulator [Chthoniobacterales bacterium]
MATTRVLIVDDEPDVIEMLSLNLRKAGGFDVSTASNGAVGLAKAREELPAAVVLDLMMPKMSGLEVCRHLKSDAKTRHISVLMLTARAEEIDRIVGLELGADDYVVKPFSPRELVLRIKAILRRNTEAAAPAGNLRIGNISLDPERHHVSVNSKPVQLTSVEFKLLRTLMQRPGRVQTRDGLLTDVWGYDSVIDTRTVDTHVRRLRDKLGKSADLLETIRGFGYRLREI